jgi:Sigma-70 region 2
MGNDAPRKAMTTEELFNSHAPFVARMLFRLGVPASELDDAVQEVFLVVHRLGGYAPGPATPTTFLAHVAFNAARSARRSERTRAARRDAADLETFAEPELRTLLILVDLEGESCALELALECRRGQGAAGARGHWVHGRCAAWAGADDCQTSDSQTVRSAATSCSAPRDGKAIAGTPSTPELPLAAAEPARATALPIASA